MLRRFMGLLAGALALVCLNGSAALAQQPQTEPRIAFVVGSSAYAAGALPTALNDAGLVAEALRSIGFEIVEGADLKRGDLVATYREFIARVEASGPDTLAFVYFSGHALSFEGENFLIAPDAQLERDSDISIEGVRLVDLMRPLAGSPARAKVMMIDAMRPPSFRPQGRALARGLEAIDPPQGLLLAYASAPGTVVPDQPGDYGAYATAIAEMLRAPGIDLETAFTHIRSRTHLSTEGRQTPWHASALSDSVELVPPQAAAGSVPPPPPIRQARPMRDIGPDEAYALAIEMDTLEGYTGFVQAYPRHPYTQRVWAMIRARREALAWMRAVEINTPQSYWTYMRRYPNGMYAFDAERRLRRLGQSNAPPPGFAMMEFDDVPMALAGEPVEYLDVYRTGPPPPRGIYGAPRPAYLANLPPPRRGGGGNDAMRILPALAIPAIAALAPAPRRAMQPGGGMPYRQGFGGRGWDPNRAGPANVNPNAAIAPSAVSPSPGPGEGRPPGWGPGGPRPPGAAGRVPPNQGARRGSGTPECPKNLAWINGACRAPGGPGTEAGAAPPPGAPNYAGRPGGRPGGTPECPKNLAWINGACRVPGGGAAGANLGPPPGPPPGGGRPAGRVGGTPECPLNLAWINGACRAPGGGPPPGPPPGGGAVAGRPAAAGPPECPKNLAWINGACRAPGGGPPPGPPPQARTGPPPGPPPGGGGARVGAPAAAGPPQCPANLAWINGACRAPGGGASPAAAAAKPAGKPPECPKNLTWRDGACRP